MSCETETATALRGAGQKVTPQRMLILSSLRHSRRHITASHILDDVRRAYPYVDVSTIYRTLNSAAALGLVSETNMGSGESEYEWIGVNRHHHLVCRSCGDVSSLDNTYLDSLATALHDELGFQADLGHFAIFGLCHSCLSHEAGSGS
ncbi:MAG TPA: transcriptional repressor [Dehalococcoidia bacterium]|nr:transcriptional repressor [Dehalococcoidia bacterium]